MLYFIKLYDYFNQQLALQNKRCLLLGQRFQLSWGPLPLMGGRWFHQRLPRLPAKHFARQQQLVLSLNYQLFDLTAANQTLHIGNAWVLHSIYLYTFDGEKQISIKSPNINESHVIAYRGNDGHPLRHDLLGGLAVDGTLGHLRQSAQSFAVQ